MKARLTHSIAVSMTIVAWIAAIGGCTTAEVSPKGPLPALPPPYVQVPHPTGYTLSDLRAIFLAPDSPKAEQIKDCDSDFKKLRELTQAKAERVQGARELVRKDPVKYHWCFYGKIAQLEDSLKNENYLDEKQKAVLDTYASLTPIARAFMQEYHDSRYMRWGVRHYRQISEWVFYRKVEMTPQATSELVEASNPFGLLRETSPTLPVLEKYGLVKPEPAPLAAPAATADGTPPTMPAGAAVESDPSAASPVPAPEPVVAEGAPTQSEEPLMKFPEPEAVGAAPAPAAEPAGVDAPRAPASESAQ
jgi:hypothetical protein